MTKIETIPKVVQVEAIAAYGLRLTFDIGLVREVDPVRQLWGPMLEPLKEP